MFNFRLERKPSSLAGMNDTPDKTMPASERFDAACVARGLTPEDVRRMGVTPDGQAILHGIAKEAGITKGEHDAAMALRFPDMPASEFAVVGGLAGGGIAAAGLPLAQLAKSGRVSWRAFSEAAPKTTAIGAVVGSLHGVAATMIVNRYHQKLRRGLSAEWDEGEAAWARREAQWTKREAERK